MKYTDQDRLAFLKALDWADVEVSDWEAKFLESNLARAVGPTGEVFSAKQREIIDGMIARYGERVKF